MLDKRYGNEPQKPSSESESLESLALPAVVELGQVVGTRGAADVLQAAGVAPETLVRRHERGDWGDLSEDDKKANNRALVDGSRLLSAYTLPSTGEKVWIITEADRSSTTLLLPEEY